MRKRVFGVPMESLECGVMEAVVHEVQMGQLRKRMSFSTIDEALEKLQASPFRAKFRLSERERAYIGEKGLDTIREHARGFIETRLAPAELPNDGRQTPMRGHPVFLAQHACACCCRKCLYKWYKIPPGIQLNRRQQEKIVNLLMAWIQRQL